MTRALFDASVVILVIVFHAFNLFADASSDSASIASQRLPDQAQAGQGKDALGDTQQAGLETTARSVTWCVQVTDLHISSRTPNTRFVRAVVTPCILPSCKLFMNKFRGLPRKMLALSEEEPSQRRGASNCEPPLRPKNAEASNT